MEKKTEIEHPRYLQSIHGQDDRNRLVERIPLFEAFLIDLGFTEEKAKALLEKQRSEINARNRRLKETEKDEIDRDVKGKLKAIAKVLYNKMFAEIEDENGIWIQHAWSKRAWYNEINKLGKKEFSIGKTPCELIEQEPSLLNALLTLPDPRTAYKDFINKLHQKYDGYILHVFVVTKEGSHTFRMRLKWRI